MAELLPREDSGWEIRRHCPAGGEERVQGFLGRGLSKTAEGQTRLQSITPRVYTAVQNPERDWMHCGKL